MHVLHVVGARPQFIKAFPVSTALHHSHKETIVHTGQHYDEMMSEIFFEELNVPHPDYHLGIGSAPPGDQIGRMMQALEPIIHKESPDVVLVYGDTNSTLAAATVAAHSDVLLGHVEAGLRSYNRDMPEEINRVMTDHSADLLFAPTDRAMKNLSEEGVSERACLTGDVMVDALHWGQQIASARSRILNELEVTPHDYLLATVHRAANTDDIDRLRGIVETLGQLDSQVILPAHPRTIDRLTAGGMLEWARNQISIIEPVGYLDFIQLLAHADRILTDSGGVQKEAFLLDTPCVTLREETEWPETVGAGWNTLVGADPDAIRRALEQPPVLDDKPHPFGHGNAAEAICASLERSVNGDQYHDRSAESIPPQPDYQRGN